MKKNLLIITCLFVLFSCTKNNNTNVPTNEDQKKSNDLSITAKAGADSLNKNDTTKKARNKSINDVSCAYSQSYSTSHWSPSYYTVIGNFPAAGAPSNIVPKGTWQAGPYAFNNQGDGNLVVYVHATGKVLWNSETFPKTTRLELQNDLNMVLYTASGPVFESQTYIFKCGTKNPRNTMLVLTVDGELCIIADGINGNGSLATVTLGGTRTFGGVVTPNNASFFKLYTTHPQDGGISFAY
ncbi:hypothetical protein SAMN05421821_11124 [Mucilaginibacter lappiensis]|uniref:Bulb-type lectin domain-containing protein n=1 Tax=Mucilaginibacter lappiensis TaxID=354630 RepID=A0ABR6PN61_9SPHI|nr:hypothetical protein [Mucilaginibacter lappiensis]MBB6111214.1 hypothetical protein [Mucilaginibacter lappiensis]SIR73120.1 hypothetical protein SAMN05421821_11124 [Mucilaginibacter lappiensis]